MAISNTLSEKYRAHDWVGRYHAELPISVAHGRATDPVLERFHSIRRISCKLLLLANRPAEVFASRVRFHETEDIGRVLIC